MWGGSSRQHQREREGERGRMRERERYDEESEEPRASEGLGSGRWGGRDTFLGTMRPVTRLAGADENAPTTARSQLWRSKDEPARDSEFGDGRDVDGGIGSGDACDDSGPVPLQREDSGMQVYEQRKRKAAAEEKQAILAAEFAVSRLEALLTFMEMGDSKALFKKLNSTGGNRRFVSRYQLESKASTHGSPGVTSLRHVSATAVNQAIFVSVDPTAAAATNADAGAWSTRQQPQRTVAAAHSSLGEFSHSHNHGNDGGAGAGGRLGGGGVSVAEGAGVPIPAGALRVRMTLETEAELREVFTFYCQYGDRLNTSYLSSAKTAGSRSPQPKHLKHPNT